MKSRISGIIPGRAILAVFLLFGGIVPVVGQEPFPEPLTLDYALSLLAEPHPTVERADAALAAARAGISAAESRQGTHLAFEGQARWIEPSELALNQENNDSRARLFFRKNLYDFGRTGNLVEAAQADLASRELSFHDTLAERRIEIMRRFFDVLIADLEFTRDNEAMAVVYVDLDKLRERHGLGQISDIELLRKESEYQLVRTRRQVSEGRQRFARARLAEILNRPGSLPPTLAVPELPEIARPLPEYESLVDSALGKNIRIAALRHEVEAAERRVEAAQAGSRPYLDVEGEVADYVRETNSTDQWRAALVLTVPILTGGSVDAAVAVQQAHLRQSRARLREAENELRQTLLEVWLELQTLKVRKEEAQAQWDYRELYLDRSRAIYEMEVRTDLGDAMVRLTEAELNDARTNYQIALAWARLDALTRSPAAMREEKGE